MTATTDYKATIRASTSNNDIADALSDVHYGHARVCHIKTTRVHIEITRTNITVWDAKYMRILSTRTIVWNDADVCERYDAIKNEWVKVITLPSNEWDAVLYVPANEFMFVDAIPYYRGDDTE